MERKYDLEPRKCLCTCDDCGAECEPYYKKKTDIDDWIKPFVDELNERLGCGN